MQTSASRGTEPDEVYQRIHQAIVRGQLMPNERLIEMELSQAYGVGRAAVRTALARLEQEGLVEHEPNRGARVRAISEAEAIEVLEARSVLEGLVARYAALRAGPEDLAALRALGEAMRAQLAAGDLLAVSELNSQFHALLQQIAGHETVRRLLGRLQPHHVRYRYRTILVPGRGEHSIAEHQAIIDAIAERDAPAAEAAMRAHLDHVVAALRQTTQGTQTPL
jgi:DNA-binding GntR family transcriptional regulator